jgi:hypothetical protein
VNVIAAGTALLLSEPPLFKPHLWFVLTDPEGQPETVVVVMMVTAKKHTDTTVLLQPGDHPFVKHESSVHYSSAKWFRVSALTKAMQNGRCHLKETMSPKLLARVRKGLLESAYTIHAVSDYCKTRFGTS